uniref:Cytochrome oxidase subunit II copper A binding domain-containing protein n=1 Tax=Alexandrium monilatum TaxID=311494 RepID=A0A7S4UXU3_9DINO
MEHRPKLNLVRERGQKWIVSGDPPKSIEELYGCRQTHNPFWARQRLLIWGNYKLLMKAEYLFFYIPTVIILGLCIPAFTTIYALEELVATTMTVKVTGRQWYWVYEVESPTDDGEEDDDE